VGHGCFATEMLNGLMWQSSRRHGTLGLSAVGQSGIDLALWDLKGKLLGQPAYRLIGDPARERFRCYGSGDDLDWSLELGFDASKTTNPVHYRQVRAGLDVLEQKVAEARDQVGSAADLMLSPVMACDVEFTVKVAERLRPYELRCIEEPLIPEAIEGSVALKRAVPRQTIATGEDHDMRIPFRQLVERRCVDIVQPDLQWCGGLTEALKIYVIAEAVGVRTIPLGAQHAVRSALRLRDTRLRAGGVPPQLTRGVPVGRGRLDPGHGSASRRFSRALGCSGLRPRDPRGRPRPVAPAYARRERRGGLLVTVIVARHVNAAQDEVRVTPDAPCRLVPREMIVIAPAVEPDPGVLGVRASEGGRNCVGSITP
jgi:hypothetical protein